MINFMTKTIQFKSHVNTNYDILQERMVIPLTSFKSDCENVLNQ